MSNRKKEKISISVQPAQPRSGRASARSRRRARGKNQNVNKSVRDVQIGSTGSVSGTLNIGVYQPHRFSTAPVHSDYPEGGLRLVAEVPSISNDGLAAYGSGTYTGMLDGGTGFTVHSVSPTAVSAYAYSSGYNMFGGNTSSSGGAVGAVAKYFRHFRFRKLGIVYEGSTGNTTNGSIQITYDRSMPELNAQVASANGASTQQSVANATSVRFPHWTQRVEHIFFDETKMVSNADILHKNFVGVAIASTKTDPVQESFFQGGVSFITDTPSNSALVVTGRYRWIIVLDLYGFSNFVNPTTPTLLSRLPDEVKEDSKDEQDVSKKILASEAKAMPPKPDEKKSLQTPSSGRWVLT